MCAGAMIIDLILKKKVMIKNKKIIVIDPSPTEDDRLNAILKARKPQKIWDWLDMIRIYNNTKVIPEFIEELRANQNVIIETKKSLKIFTRKKYKLMNVKIYTDLLKQIHKGVINEQKGDPRIIALISLLYTCGGYRQLIPTTLVAYTKQESEKIQNRRNQYQQYGAILKQMKAISQNTEYYELIQAIPKYSRWLSDTG